MVRNVFNLWLLEVDVEGGKEIMAGFRKRVTKATRGLRVWKGLTWRGRRHQIKRALAPGIYGRYKYQRATLSRTKKKKRR